MFRKLLLFLAVLFLCDRAAAQYGQAIVVICNDNYTSISSSANINLVSPVTCSTATKQAVKRVLSGTVWYQVSRAVPDQAAKTRQVVTGISRGKLTYGIEGRAYDRQSGTTADSFMPTFDVRVFGAKGDGVTDDTAAIQSAVNAAQNTGKGGYVFLPAGKYKIGGPIRAYTDTGNLTPITISGNNITFCGVGDDSVLYVPIWTRDPGDGTKQAFLWAYNSTANQTGVCFCNFKFLGAVGQATPVGGSDSVTPTNAIQLGGPTSSYAISNSGVTGVHCDSSGTCVTLNGGSSNFAVGPVGRNNYITNNIVTNGARSGFNAVSGGLGDDLVAYNQIQNLRGLGFEWGSPGTFIGNTAENVWNSCFAFGQAPTQTGWTLVSANTCNLIGAFYKAAGNTVSPCIQLNESGGIYRAKIIGNALSNCAGQGIVLPSTNSTDLEISDNVVDCFGVSAKGHVLGVGSSFAGIEVLNNTRVRVTNNRVRACGGVNDVWSREQAQWR
jgi:hypothetical protein